MTTFFLTLSVLLLAMAGLAVGVVFGRRALRSSCGGNALMRLCGACKLGAPDK